MWPLVGQWVEQVIWMSCLLSPTGTHLKDQDGRSVGGLFLWGGPDCGLAGRREEGKPEGSLWKPSPRPVVGSCWAALRIATCHLKGTGHRN